MKLNALRDVFTPQIDEVDAALARYLDQATEPVGHYGMIRYHLGFADEELRLLKTKRIARGKRLRPIFCMLIGRAVSAPPEALSRVVLAAELMHSASLAHDDIQDDEPIRWGRPTAWKLFGVGQAINVGDALVGKVYELLLSLLEEGLPREIVLNVVETFNRAHLRMAEGQHLDLLHEGRLELSVDDYLNVISLKTAAACECVAHSAALIADRSRQVEKHYQQFGHAFGMLYQLCDDMLSVWGDAKDTGKVALGDVLLRKSTLPLLYGVELGGLALRTSLLGCGGPKEPFAETEARRIREELTALGIKDLCGAKVRVQRDRALMHLAAAGGTSFERTLLEAMTNLTAQAVGVEPLATMTRNVGSEEAPRAENNETT